VFVSFGRADFCSFSLLLQDTLKIATGCQDGLVRIFDTVNPSASPQELKIISAPLDGIMKVAWLPSDSNVLMVCKKNSSVEKWDIRNDPANGPAQSVNLGTGLSVMDAEISSKHGLILGASGNKVAALSLNTLDSIKEFTMPNPMTFKEEGGVSLNSDGSKLYTVSKRFAGFLLRFYVFPLGRIRFMVTRI
jgi:WD40 repeat protein